MKKLISILLSAVLCTISIHATVFAEDTKSGIVQLESVTGNVGDTVSMQLSVKDNPGIISLVTDLSYDSTALKLTKVTKSADFWTAANMTPGGDLTAQPFRIIWFDGLAKTDFTENGTLAELSFEILKAGSHTVEAVISDGDTFNSRFDPVSFTVSSGKVDTESGAAVTTTAAVSTTAASVTTAPVTTAAGTAAVTTSAPAAAEGSGRLTLSKAAGPVGSTVNVPISIADNPGFVSLVADISFDSTALKLKDVKKDADFWKSATMTPGGDLTAQPFRIIWFDGLAKTDFKENGTLAVLSFEILKTGSHAVEVTVSADDTFNTAFTPVPVAGCTGTIETPSVTTAPVTTAAASVTTATETAPAVSGAARGDVNADGEITVADAQMVLNAYVKGMSGQDNGLTAEQAQAADVNGDKAISVEDAQTVLLYYVRNTLSNTPTTWEELLGKKPAAARPRR